MPHNDWSGQSDEEFMDEWTEFGQKVEEDKAKLRDYSHEFQRRERVRQLNLEPGDIALLQSMSPEGIESAEAVMTGEDNE